MFSLSCRRPALTEVEGIEDPFVEENDGGAERDPGTGGHMFSQSVPSPKISEHLQAHQRVQLTLRRQQGGLRASPAAISRRQGSQLGEPGRCWPRAASRPRSVSSLRCPWWRKVEIINGRMRRKIKCCRRRGTAAASSRRWDREIEFQSAGRERASPKDKKRERGGKEVLSQVEN